MARRRGFFAELQHQQKQEAKALARREKEEERARKSALASLERARKEEERAQKQLERATASEFKRLEKEAKLAHIERMEATAEAKNSELNVIYLDLDEILAATLTVDDYVDLIVLKDRTLNTPFSEPTLEIPTPRPEPIEDPVKPELLLPEKPTGFGRIFSSAKYKKEAEYAKNDLRKKLQLWRELVDENARLGEIDEQAFYEAERSRLSQLKNSQIAHNDWCAESAEKIQQLIDGLAYGTPEAVQNYISLVMYNSIYPETLNVDHEFKFDISTSELFLRVNVCPPDSIPCIKNYKYTKSSDEITSVNLTKKACKDRYSSIIHQIALRSLHEIFEADRKGLIKTISLEVGTKAIIPATGLSDFILFVATGAEREEFNSYNLSAVDPLATLNHLGASISKNPFDLVPTNSKGVRK